MKQILTHNPKRLTKEIKMLRRLGLTDEDIKYLVWLKAKNQIQSKWN